ncbi:MAG: sugar phosphate isomerase/epimerase, partial [Longimicrobiales bacterium]
MSAAPFAPHIAPRSFAGRPGVQLYTVRDAMAKDVDRTLAALAEIGFREVELAGTYGMTPA